MMMNAKSGQQSAGDQCPCHHCPDNGIAVVEQVVGSIAFTVTNEAQRKWIAENLLRNLEGSFQQLLGSNRVRLQVEAAEYIQEEKIYLPSEQAKDLMSKNEEVKNLVIDLGLDI